MKTYARLLAASCLAALITVNGFGQDPSQPNASALENATRSTVSTTGTGAILVAPDELSFSIEISLEAGSLLEAQQQNRELANKAIAYLRDRGVAEDHIQTQYLNVSVQYRDREAKVPRYYASQTIEVQLKDIAAYEAINAGLLERGITGLRGPRFATSKLEALENEARVEAVRDAKAKAELLAGALGQGVGKAIAIDDRSQQPQGPMLVQRMMSADMKAGNNGPGIALGQLEIKHEVTVIFELL